MPQTVRPTSVKASAFISYSRKNKTFVQWLHAELTDQGRDIWCDWEDIPGGTDWWKEIQIGINQSDNFIFVISPQSCTSAVCLRELNHAIAQHKRIVPIVHHIAESIPPELSRLNWVIFDSFSEGLEILTSALDFDLEDTRQHTCLLTLVHNWEENAKDSSYLLRGKQLVKAENWLEKTTDTPPFPTQSQREFILQSQKLRAAIILVRLSLIGVLLIGLAVRQC
ncbi:MAG TPA: toll/interleukin-1 receptor domain-containing protein [Cyanophyceae cyanobacterium]